MTSTPYQMALMKIRRIYRWDDPSETAKYLIAYVFLWAVNYITGAAVKSHLAGRRKTTSGLNIAPGSRPYLAGSQTPIIPTHARRHPRRDQAL